MTVQYPNKLDKNRPIYFAIDNIYGGTGSPTSADLKIKNNIVNSLKAQGFTFKYAEMGPNHLYQAMKKCYDNGETNAIIFSVANGVDPTNLKEVSFTGYDNRGTTTRKRGNEMVFAFMWDACDFTRSDGSCYEKIKLRNPRTDVPTGGYFYNPKQFCDENKIWVINVSSNQHRNPERADYTGDKVVAEFAKLFTDNPSETIVNSGEVTTETPTSSGKTLATRTISESYSTPFYEKVYRLKTDKQGVFRVKPTLPYRGRYKATMRYGGDKTHNGTSVSVNIYDYDKNAKIFVEQLLEQTITDKYTDGTVNTSTTGSIGDNQHYKKVVTTQTYTNGTVTNTSTITVDMDKVVKENENPISTDVVVGADTTVPGSTVVTGTQSPFDSKVPVLATGVPQVQAMNHAGKQFVMVQQRTYTLTENQYRGVFKRDSQSMQLNNYKVSRYTAFESEDTETWNVVERTVWNAVEESVYYYMVGNQGPAWPERIIVDFANHTTKIGSTTINWKAPSCIYHWLSDYQNFSDSCGDTSASVCSQVLHNYISEQKFSREYGRSVAPSTIVSMLKRYNMGGTLVSSNRSTSLEWLKGGKPFVWHMYGHYFAFTDISDDGTKILVCNSAYGRDGVHSNHDWGLESGWRGATSNQYGSGGYGQSVKAYLNWSISLEEQNKLNNFYESMGGAWTRPANKTNESLRRQ